MATFRRLLWLSFVLLVSSCRLAAAPGVVSGGLVTHHIGGHDSGLDTRVAARHQLMVFLPGTNGSPGGYQTLLKDVLALGYHAVSLDYPNTISMGALAQDDLSVYGALRNEVVTGADASPLIAVSRADSIEQRLVTVLKSLGTQYPEEGWGAYISGDEPVWSAMVVSGYSQGAGHAAYLAKVHALARVVLFSGVVDGRVTAPAQSADWITDAQTLWATPFSKFRFFVSLNDGYFPAIGANLIAFGWDQDSAASNVDGASVYGARPVLVTSVVTGAQAHPSTCEDGATPITGGVPLYRPVWRSLFE